MTAVVTGAASGIGAATAQLLARRGARVFGLDRAPYPSSDPDARRADVEMLVADVTDQSSVDAAVATVVRRAGGIDVVVNNAGVGAAGSVVDNSDDEWWSVLDVNLMGIVRTTRAALPHLERSERAAIVNTCSVAAEVGLPQRAVYSASKGAVLALTRAMAADHLAHGVRVTAVNPGTADTPWVGRLLQAAADPAAERAALEARQPTGRLVSALEVAEAIAYLASPRSGATTGTSLTVDGGLTGLRLPAAR
ncbi:MULTISPECIES: SDR family NAD(P)-dependent oxidoreductase [unclassified Ornithinimicrobium]|uniref:SDR family NAD(P)-dependent oxidoreductase n=1 Tax=unclassified Ornithinimicrobium TaxID=2615080 RepID=UPI003852729C